MERLYKIFCVWMVVAMALAGLAPAVVAQAPLGSQEPGGLVGKDFVPPRPDLLSKLQMAEVDRTGFGLNAAMGAEEAAIAYQKYLAKKLDPRFRGQSVTKTFGSGRLLQTSPEITRVLVALVDFPDLANNQLDVDDPLHVENNTDYRVSPFDRDHYMRLLFSETNDWSARNYFREASNWGISSGYDLQGDVHDWTTLPVTGTVGAYGDDDPSGGVDNDATDGIDLSTFVMDAANTLDGSGFTPAGGWFEYSSSTGVPYLIDYFVIVHAGKGQEAGGDVVYGDSIWSTSGSLATEYRIPNTSLWVKDFIVVSEDAPVGVFVHELGHLFGLPDTWNPGSGADEYDDMAWPGLDQGGDGEASPAFWDPMGQGCWLGSPLGTKPASMTAWERWKLDWLDPRVWRTTDDPTSIYVAQLEKATAANKAIKIELPEKTCVPAHSETHMWQAPWPAFTTADSTLRHDFEITATSSAELRFWHWYDLKNTEMAIIEVDDNPSDGLNYTVIDSFTNDSLGNCGDDGWVEYSIDLSPSQYPSKWVSVRFRLTRTLAIGGLGWFLDDFELIQDGQVTWSDDCETSDLGPGQGDASFPTYWDATNFSRNEDYTSEHYYLVEWRSDAIGNSGFDEGLREAYNWSSGADKAKGKAEFFRYNPGFLFWYVDPIYQEGDNDVLWHPGEGFLLAIDSHPDPLEEASTSNKWRTRVQMMDATFRESASTVPNSLTDSVGVLNDLGDLPATNVFTDAMASYPWWDPMTPSSSAKTLQYGVHGEVIDENPGQGGAWLSLSLDAANMEDSYKDVDETTAEPGETLEYTLVLINTGIADAQTIWVTDTAPAHTSYISGSLSVDSSEIYTPTESSDGFEWYGTVLLSTPVTITFQVVLDPVIDNGTLIQNVAHVFEGTVHEVDVYSPETEVVSAPCLVGSTKVAEPTSVLAGGLVTYTITLINSGTMDSATTTITDCIPEDTSYWPGSLQYSAGSGSYNSMTECIEWSGPVEVGTSTFITFTVKVTPGCLFCSPIANEAVINCELQPEFSIHSNNVAVDSGPNLWESTKTVVTVGGGATAAPGEALTYTITLYNGGNLEANVTLADVVPANTTYVSGTLASSTGTPDDSDPTTMQWSGTVGIDSTETVQFSVEITSPLMSGTLITNTVPIVVTGGETYTRTVVTEVLSEPRWDLSIKEAIADPAGEVITYTITLFNDGTQNATVHLTDTIPTGTEYKSGPSVSPPTAPSGSYGGGQILWTGPITRNTGITLTFAVSITLSGSGVITNCAEINDGVTPVFYLCDDGMYVAGLEAVDPNGDHYCGDLVPIEIQISNVADFKGFQITVDWDPSILNLPVTSIENGTWFSPASWPIKSSDNISGTSTVLASLWGDDVLSTNGGAYTLYTLNFRAISAGTSPITITTASILSDGSFNPIPYHRTNTSVTVLGRSLSGYAYLQARSDHTGAQVYWEGDSEPLAETDAAGFYSFCPPVGEGEEMTLQIKKDGYLYGEKDVTVTGSSMDLGSVELLGGDALGIGTGITETTPMTCAVDPGRTATLAEPQDGEVRVNDLTFIGYRFGSAAGDPDWGLPYDPCYPEYENYKADIDGNDLVNLFDLVLVATNFNKVAPDDVEWP